MSVALELAMRWLHLASVVVLLGGVFYGARGRRGNARQL